ncbi:polysaccharide biosynthesis protein [Marinobacterium sp. AK62]|uniref:Polysaccharide biosynthesis protein n=1 Tax=Marinobacterium alkalitolerans TaxID=1542925 RepID=A0ABS3ZEP8_9GAMM|nr:nucleoside-diphosphate sugar epimerase/dehydratase [Marinobacterium alkalitolerans]MBP0050154.1 polysaccharide biosynthesis protein [Marinobacterium alkalitolerans]
MFSKLIDEFLHLSRRRKQAVLVASDIVMLFMACWMALALRLGEIWMPLQNYWLPCLLVPLISVPVMIRLGLYRAVIRYMSHTTIWVSVKAVTLSVLIWATVVMVLQVPVPRSVLFIYWFTAVSLVAGSRLYARWLIRHVLPGGQRRYQSARVVVLFGAGTAGAQLANALGNSPELQVVAFIDDDNQKQGTEIAGLRVYALDQLPSLIERYGIESVLLSISNLSRSARRQLLERISEYPVSVKVVPGVAELASGEVNVSDIRDIDVVDLLGRDAVEPNTTLLNACVEQKAVMVTGAGGSIGSELCRQILRLRPRCLILLEQSEYALYSIEQELRDQLERDALEVQLIAALANVQDRSSVQAFMQRYQVDTVYHAAAYKHVPMVEHNVIAGLHNNVMGTLHTAEAAIEAGVSHFVLVSTDKAVRPTNVMGASKRLAEMVLQALAEREQARAIRFAMVRFGNVLGSSGSVIPLFRKQIEQGGPVTVTHPDITRYFMTIPEAAALVIQAGSMASTGDVFVLDMGKPIKIADLACEMVRLAGLTVKDAEHPEGDIEIVYSGLRPGEKLYEELLIGDDVKGTDHPMIMRATEAMLPWDVLQTRLDQLEKYVKGWNYVAIRQLLLETVDGYQPEADIVDWLSTDQAPLTVVN